MALLNSTAFEFTAEEKAECSRDILTSLVRCIAIVNNPKGTRALSMDDCTQALGYLHDALTLAYDEDLRDVWAQAHLYLGHLMRALRRSDEAEDAYAEAASVRSPHLSEQEAVKQAVLDLSRIQHQKKADHRLGGFWGGYAIGPEPPTAVPTDAKTCNRNLRQLLGSAAELMSGNIPTMREVGARREQPCVVTPAADALPQSTGKRAELKQAPRSRRAKVQLR